MILLVLLLLLLLMFLHLLLIHLRQCLLLYLLHLMMKHYHYLYPFLSSSHATLPFSSVIVGHLLGLSTYLFELICQYCNLLNNPFLFDFVLYLLLLVLLFLLLVQVSVLYLVRIIEILYHLLERFIPAILLLLLNNQ